MDSSSKKAMGQVKIETAAADFALALKRKELGGRLSSFKPPRDLSLSNASSPITLKSIKNATSARRNVFVPNVNVTRKKASSTPVIPDVKSNELSTRENRPERKMPNKRKANYIQTEGVFTEREPAKPIPFARVKSEPMTVQLEKPKLNLTKKINKKEEDGKMKNLLKDDFIDDPHLVPNLKDRPMGLPLLQSAKMNCLDLEATFDALQVKSEKMDLDVEYGSTKIMNLFDESSPSKLFVFDFPNETITKEIDSKHIKDIKQEKTGDSNNSVKQEPGCRLSNLGEGQWGTLKILQDGTSYIAVGNDCIPIEITRHCPRQNVVSITSDQLESRGSFVNLGSVSGNFTCSTVLNLRTSLK